MSPSLLILKIFPTPPSNAYLDPPPRLLFKIFFFLTCTEIDDLNINISHIKITVIKYEKNMWKKWKKIHGSMVVCTLKIQNF